MIEEALMVVLCVVGVVVFLVMGLWFGVLLFLTLGVLSVAAFVKGLVSCE